MASVWEKAISILNSGRSYLITAVMFTWCNSWIFSKLRMHIRMPTAHIMAMSIKVGKASIEIILCHSDQTMQKVEQFGRPIGILFQIQTRKCVIAGTIPGHQPCFVLPFSTNFDLKSLIKSQQIQTKHCQQKQAHFFYQIHYWLIHFKVYRLILAGFKLLVKVV